MTEVTDAEVGEIDLAGVAYRAEGDVRPGQGASARRLRPLPGGDPQRGRRQRGLRPQVRRARRPERVTRWEIPMRAALELASAATAWGDVPIGAVVLSADGDVV